MKRVLVLALLISLVSVLGFSQAKTWTVDDNRAECPDADFTSPLDAVNAASPGDTVKVYPGQYVNFELDIYKDGLSLIAVDEDPTKTLFTNVRIFILASDVTLSGFTFDLLINDLRGYQAIAGNGDAAIKIGYRSCWVQSQGYNNNTVSKCLFEHGALVRIGNSSGNMILNNTFRIFTLPLFVNINLPALFVASYSADSPSTNNKVINNDFPVGGMAIGITPWDICSPSSQNTSGTKVHGNRIDYISIMGCFGRKIFSGNVAYSPDTDVQFWIIEATDYVIPGNANHGWPPGWEDLSIIK